MRKTIIGIYALATMFTACSNDETLDVVAKIPITFGNVFVEKSTRAAADKTYGGGTVTLGKFKVYGTAEASNGNTVNIYNGDEVTGTVGTDTWTCANTQYWVDGCDYDFVALVDANSVEIDQSTGIPTTIEYAVSSQNDLLLAKTSVQKDDSNFGKEVDFTFNHLLAKAVFTFTNNFAEESGVELTVKDIKITNAPKEGTYSISKEVWTISTENTNIGDISFDSSGAILPGGETGQCGNVKLLLPGTYTFDILFTIAHNKGGSDTSKSMSTGKIEIKAGHSYNFTGELNSSNVEGVVPIKFTITEDTDWENDDDENVDY